MATITMDSDMPEGAKTPGADYAWYMSNGDFIAATNDDALMAALRLPDVDMGEAYDAGAYSYDLYKVAITDSDTAEIKYGPKAVCSVQATAITAAGIVE